MRLYLSLLGAVTMSRCRATNFYTDQHTTLKTQFTFYYLDMKSRLVMVYSHHPHKIKILHMTILTVNRLYKKHIVSMKVAKGIKSLVQGFKSKLMHTIGIKGLNAIT